MTFSHPSGAYEDPFWLSLSAPEGWTVYYTTDGSVPVVGESSVCDDGRVRIKDLRFWRNQLATSQSVELMYYSGSYTYVPRNVDVPKATVIRAMAASPDGTQVTPVTTATYFVGDTYTDMYGDMLVVQLTIDPSDLLDYDTGIFALGAVFDEWSESEEAQGILQKKQWWNIVANYTQSGVEWERPAVIEVYDGADAVSAAAACGVRVQGSSARASGQRSLDIYFRSSYGYKTLDYPLLPNRINADGMTPEAYSSFTLYNGGNDCIYTKFQSVLISHLASSLNVTTQEARPAILFINGEYWGILSLQERHSASTLAGLYGIDVEDIAIVRSGTANTEDAAALYDELRSWQERDLSDDATYAEFAELVDIESFIDFCAIECYIANAGWSANHNEQLWRSLEVDPENSYADGKWRWMLYGTDYSMGIYSVTQTKYNAPTVMRALSDEPLFGAAMRNHSFRHAFLERLEGLCGSDEGALSTASVNDALDEQMATYGPYLPATYARFGESNGQMYDSRINELRTFAEKRPDAILTDARHVVFLLDEEQGL